MKRVPEINFLDRNILKMLFNSMEWQVRVCTKFVINKAETVDRESILVGHFGFVSPTIPTFELIGFGNPYLTAIFVL
jgi:hypothetical protein